MKQFKQELSNIPIGHLFLIFSVGYVLISYITNTYLLTEDFYVQAWSEQFSAERIAGMLKTTKRLTWVIYILTPVVFVLKILLVALTIMIGLLLFGIDLSFKNIIRIVLLAETVLFLSTASQLVYFFYTGINTFDDVNSFAPLSLFSLIQQYDVPSYIVYPLQVINLFELVYWALLAVGLKLYLDSTFANTFRIVASSYGLGLLLWLATVVFIQVQSS